MKRLPVPKMDKPSFTIQFGDIKKSYINQPDPNTVSQSTGAASGAHQMLQKDVPTFVLPEVPSRTFKRVFTQKVANCATNINLSQNDRVTPCHSNAALHKRATGNVMEKNTTTDNNNIFNVIKNQAKTKTVKSPTKAEKPTIFRMVTRSASGSLPNKRNGTPLPAIGSIVSYKQSFPTAEISSTATRSATRINNRRPPPGYVTKKNTDGSTSQFKHVSGQRTQVLNLQTNNNKLLAKTTLNMESTKNTSTTTIAADTAAGSNVTASNIENPFPGFSHSTANYSPTYAMEPASPSTDLNNESAPNISKGAFSLLTASRSSVATETVLTSHNSTCSNVDNETSVPFETFNNAIIEISSEESSLLTPNSPKIVTLESFPIELVDITNSQPSFSEIKAYKSIESGKEDWPLEISDDSKDATNDSHADKDINSTKPDLAIASKSCVSDDSKDASNDSHADKDINSTKPDLAIETDSEEDSDTDSELYFDLAAAEDCDGDQEEPTNTELLDKLCTLALPNRDEIFRGLRNVQCPSHRDPHFFYKQNEKTLQHVFESLETAPVETELADNPDGLKIPLMQHQRHALAWLQFSEKRRPYGGLLADDMGLGKTLTMLSLVMAEKNRLESGDDDDDWHPSEGGTLVICPASLLRQWENEVNNKFQFALMPLVFHGNVHQGDVERLNSFDVVITTYDTVINARLATHLLNMKWRRIVLDEAHIVRNPDTLKSQMVCQLRAKYRWALTGTPIQNKETDVFAILKFLRFAPFDDKAFWRSWSHDHKRLSVVLKSVMLRRTKAELQKQNILFKLPPRTEEPLIITLSEGEMMAHTAIMSFSKVLVENFILQRERRKENLPPSHLYQMKTNKSKDYAEFLKKLSCDERFIGQHVILVLILRLTQICCHPALAEAMCYDYDDLPSSSTIKFSFGNVAIKHEGEPPCKISKTDEDSEPREPTTREILSIKNSVFHRSQPSSKMLEVMRILNERVLRTKDKAVIVSQWTGFLNIMGDFLECEGVKTLPFNGKMSLEERDEALGVFNCAVGDVKVLLLSLKCGGVGLNLTAANHLILLDLHWNPQMEAQAQDRVYRLGQTKPVFVYKFFCHDTIEERIKMVQEDKLKLAENLLDGATALKSGLRFSAKELKKLFGLE